MGCRAADRGSDARRRRRGPALAGGQLLGECRLVAARAVEALDAGNQGIAALLVEADGGGVALLRGGLDQEEPPAGAAHVVLGEGEQGAAEAAPLAGRIDCD